MIHWVHCAFAKSDGNVYFVRAINEWQGRIKLTKANSVTLIKYLDCVSLDADFRSKILVVKSLISPSKEPENLDEASIVSSITDESSAKTPKTSKSSKSGSRSQSIQTEFSNSVLNRDSHACVFCNETTSLQADHIFEVKNTGDVRSAPDILAGYGIVSINEIRNGLTLCTDCHQMFGNSALCCVTITGVDDSKVYTIEVADCLVVQKKKWQDLQGKLVRVPDKKYLKGIWPSDALFAYRETVYREKTENRHKQRTEFQCKTCFAFFKSKKKLESHQQSPHCLKNTGRALLPSKFSTPAKSSAAVGPSISSSPVSSSSSSMVSVSKMAIGFGSSSPRSL